MKQRPTGVVVSAIAIGFVSLGLLAMAGFMVVGALVSKGTPQATVTIPGQVPPSAAALMGMMFFMALVTICLAIWAGATCAGLLKMRSWARISAMIIGGGLAALSLFGLLGSIAAPVLMKSAALPPGTSQQQLHVIFAAMAFLCLVVALIGVWWIVYYALASTRKAFAETSDAAGNPLPVPERRVRPQQVGPLTDFTFAQPIPPAELPKPLAEDMAESETPKPPTEV